MKKLLSLMTAMALVLTLAGCGNKEQQPVEPVEPVEPTPAPVVESFKSNYVDQSKGFGGDKNDTYIFEGKTTDGIITELNFDVISDKGTEKEISHKDIYGYMMNVSDIKIENGDLSLSVNAYDVNVQSKTIMYQGSLKAVNDNSKFSDLFVGFYGQPISNEDALTAYSYLAKEYGVELTNDTLLKDLLAPIGAYKDGKFVEGFNTRVSFAGYHGGRTLGEQLDLIAKYILDNKMTLEQVSDMFNNVNQEADILDRDTISGVTILFNDQYKNMIYTVLHDGKLPEKEEVVKPTETELKDGTFEATEKGFAGDIKVSVTVKDGKLVEVKVLEQTESIPGACETIPANMVKENKIDVDTVAGNTVSSEAIIKAVHKALEA